MSGSSRRTSEPAHTRCSTDLTDHPLLTVKAIPRARGPPSGRPGGAQRRQAPGRARGTGRRAVDRLPGESPRGSRTKGCWMVLRTSVCAEPYRKLLDECLDEVAPLVGGREGGMSQREGFIFLSAPGSVTPAHFDPEHNFLLQIRGQEVDERRGLPGRRHRAARGRALPPRRRAQYRVQAGRTARVRARPRQQRLRSSSHAPLGDRARQRRGLALNHVFTPATEDAIVLSKVNAGLRKLGPTDDPGPARRRRTARRCWPGGRCGPRPSVFALETDPA